VLILASSFDGLTILEGSAKAQTAKTATKAKNQLEYGRLEVFKYDELTMNKAYNLENKDEKLSYFKFPLSNLEIIPNEIKIETTELKSDSSSKGVIGVHYEPFKMKNYENILKSELGKPITLDSEFIKSALEKNEQIYLTVFCKKCQYKINILPSGDMKSVKNFVQIPRMRNLVEEADFNNTVTRMNFLTSPLFIPRSM